MITRGSCYTFLFYLFYKGPLICICIGFVGSFLTFDIDIDIEI
jgi:hypothetical protein